MKLLIGDIVHLGGSFSHVGQERHCESALNSADTNNTIVLELEIKIG